MTTTTILDRYHISRIKDHLQHFSALFRKTSATATTRNATKAFPAPPDTRKNIHTYLSKENSKESSLVAGPVAASASASGCYMDNYAITKK
jgi:hypothetical protein